MNRLNLNLRLQTLTGDMTCAELRHLIKDIEYCRHKQRADYELFATGEVCRITHQLAETPIEAAYVDAISEAIQRPIDWSSQKTKIKKHSRFFKQPFKRDEVDVWARQHLLSIRTYQARESRASDEWLCIACDQLDDEDHPVHSVMLMMGEMAGPFCPRCLRRIPRTWYYKERL